MFKMIAKTAVVAVTLAGISSGAAAKDWVEKVQVKKDGIDIIPIEVAANSNAYTGVATNSHKFALRLYGKAKNGKRIVAMKVGTFKGVLYFESDGALWSKSFQHRDVANGTKRSVAINYKPTIPVKKLRWQGWDPRQACALNMDKKIKAGMTKSQVLSKEWITTAKAYFELDAIAAKKGKAKKNKWNMHNTTNERDGYGYEVRVKCRKGV